MRGSFIFKGEIWKEIYRVGNPRFVFLKWVFVSCLLLSFLPYFFPNFTKIERSLYSFIFIAAAFICISKMFAILEGREVKNIHIRYQEKEIKEEWDKELALYKKKKIKPSCLIKVKEFVSEQGNVPFDKINDDFDIYSELATDRLDWVEFLMSVEEELGVIIPDELGDKLSTPLDIAIFIEIHRKVNSRISFLKFKKE